MSFRYYPRYVLGNPQRRVFLPNFWLKLVPNEVSKPPNHVQFKCPIEMSDADIRNYLEKIYKVPVMSVHTVAKDGNFKRAPGKPYLTKEEDYRTAFVQLPKEVSFEFPDLFPVEKDAEEDKSFHRQKERLNETEQKIGEDSAQLKQVPSWFGI